MKCIVKLDILVPGIPGSGDGRYVQGGTAWFDTYDLNDIFKVHIVDVDNIGIVASTFARTYEVKILVSNPDLQLKPGMVCDVSLKENVA